ncbi:MAG: hypothetical protein LQ337_003482 [Flavoplaca oasis]|nr:MAG: hypothetical protein LQ337_003482 [Flavoplaca oasis]
MSCRQSTIKAEIERIKVNLENFPSTQRAALQQALDNVESRIRGYWGFSSQTEFYGPTFSTQLMMDQMANPYAENRKWTVSCPLESEVLKIHQEVLRWQSVNVQRLLEAMIALREALVSPALPVCRED